MFTTSPKSEQNRTKARKQLLLAVLSMTLGDITKACKRARIHRDTYYDWRNRDPEFKKATDSAGAESLGYFINKQDDGF